MIVYPLSQDCVSYEGSNGLFWQGWDLSGNAFAFSVASDATGTLGHSCREVKSGYIGVVSGAVEGHAALAAVGGK